MDYKRENNRIILSRHLGLNIDPVKGEGMLNAMEEASDRRFCLEDFETALFSEDSDVPTEEARRMFLFVSNFMENREKIMIPYPKAVEMFENGQQIWVEDQDSYTEGKPISKELGDTIEDLDIRDIFYDGDFVVV